MYSTEVLLLVCAMLVNTPLLECGRTYLRLRTPEIGYVHEPETRQGSSSLLPSELAQHLKPTQHSAPRVGLPAQTRSQQHSIDTWQIGTESLQPLRRKHQYSAVRSTGSRHLLLVWMPWSETSDSSSSNVSSGNDHSSGSDRSSSSDSGSSDTSSNSTKGSSSGSAAAEPSPTDGCSGKSGRTFYAQIRVLLAMNVSEEISALADLESQVGVGPACSSLLVAPHETAEVSTQAAHHVYCAVGSATSTALSCQPTFTERTEVTCYSIARSAVLTQRLAVPTGTSHLIPCALSTIRRFPLP
jgi:hypothetical protein